MEVYSKMWSTVLDSIGQRPRWVLRCSLHCSDIVKTLPYIQYNPLLIIEFNSVLSFPSMKTTVKLQIRQTALALHVLNLSWLESRKLNLLSINSNQSGPTCLHLQHGLARPPPFVSSDFWQHVVNVQRQWPVGHLGQKAPILSAVRLPIYFHESPMTLHADCIPCIPPRIDTLKSI